MRLLLVAVVLVLAGCAAEPLATVQDSASCPGEECTDDARRVLDQVAAVEGVTSVEDVSRSYGLDRGAARSAEVSAEVGDRAEAIEVAGAVLEVLADWSEAEAGDAVATVSADPPTPVRQVQRAEQPLTAGFYDPCDPAACRSAVSGLEQAVAALEGVTGVTSALDGGTLRLRVTSDVPSDRALRAVLDAVETDLDRRVAERVRVVVEHTGPVVVTLRNSDGNICEQPQGMLVTCDSSNAIPGLSPAA